jgi:hypothetical protein
MNEKRIVKGLVAKVELDRMYNFTPTLRKKFFRENAERLAENGYDDKSHFITPKVLSVIFEILGPPETGYEF